MDVYDAVASRRAVRAFTDQPVPREVLTRVLTAAARAPSGGNLQPWNTYVLTGASLAELKRRVAARVAAGDPGDEREFEMYPSNLKSPYRERRFAAGEQRYAALGIRREDTQIRAKAVAANWSCFGAPAALFSYINGLITNDKLCFVRGARLARAPAQPRRRDSAASARTNLPAGVGQRGGEGEAAVAHPTGVDRRPGRAPTLGPHVPVPAELGGLRLPRRAAASPRAVGSGGGACG